MSTKNKADIEQLLRDGYSVQLPTTGWSMYPLIVNGRDQVVISPLLFGEASSKGRAEHFHRGDVLLYRRDSGILVLHRVWKVRPEGLYMVGDNQIEIEGPLRPDQVRGRMTAVVRKGRTISVNSPLYRIPTHVWLALRPLRPAISHGVHNIKKLFLMKKKENKR